MRSIRDFNRTGGEKPQAQSTLQEEVGAIAAKYKGKSEQELMSALIQSVHAAKSNGTFSVEQLDSFVRTVSPSLDESSRERLLQLIAMIKSE